MINGINQKVITLAQSSEPPLATPNMFVEEPRTHSLSLLKIKYTFKIDNLIKSKINNAYLD